MDQVQYGDQIGLFLIVDICVKSHHCFRGARQSLQFNGDEIRLLFITILILEIFVIVIIAS